MSKRSNQALMGRKGERFPAIPETPDDLLLETEDSHLFSDDEDPLPKKAKGDNVLHQVTVPSGQTRTPMAEMFAGLPPATGVDSASTEGSSVATQGVSSKPKVASTVRSVRATDNQSPDMITFFFEKGMKCPVTECGEGTFKHASNYWRHWLSVHRASRRVFTCVPCGDDPTVDRTGRHGMSAQFRDKTALLNHFHVMHHCVDLNNMTLTENWFTMTFPTSNNSINPAPYMFGRKIDETKEVQRLSDLGQEEAASQVRKYALALALRCPDMRGILSPVQQLEWELMENIFEGACAVTALQNEPGMATLGLQEIAYTEAITLDGVDSSLKPTPAETHHPTISTPSTLIPVNELTSGPSVVAADAVKYVEPPAAQAPVSPDPFDNFVAVQASVGGITAAVDSLRSLISLHASCLAKTSDPFEALSGLKAQLAEEQKQRQAAEAEIAALRTELCEQHREVEALQQEVSRQRGELAGNSSSGEALKRMRIRKEQAEAAQQIAEAEAAHSHHLLQLSRKQVATLQKELLSGGVTPAAWESEI